MFDEIEVICREHGFSQINMVDDTFTLNHPHATGLCRELIRRHLPVKWTIFSRVDTLTRELLDLMREAGIGTFASFILGLPGETPERALETEGLATELSERWGTLYGFHYCSPFPGPELFDQAQKLGTPLEVAGRRSAGCRRTDGCSPSLHPTASSGTVPEPSTNDSHFSWRGRPLLESSCINSVCTC